MVAAALCAAVPSVAFAGGTTSLDLYSNVNFEHSTGEGDHPTFAVGGVDFFITSQLGSRIRLISESVLEILEDGNVFDLERIYMDYRVSDALINRCGALSYPAGLLLHGISPCDAVSDS